MNYTLITSKEDRQWLKDTHLRGLGVKAMHTAEIIGNEDCPQEIRVYRTKPKFNTPPSTVFKLQEDGSYKG